MRCNNCGWQNEAARVRCEKCNYPLDGSLQLDQSEDAPQSPPKNLSNDPALSSTIAGSRPNLDPWDAPNSGELSKEPPRSFDPTPVPNNDPTPRPRREDPPKPEEKKKSASQPFEPQPENKFNKTFDPSRLRGSKRSFSLKLIAKEGEDVERELDFSGETIELSRNNVDPDNFSITSKSQAVIEYIDGAWYIVDKSELQTTYVQAREPYKLQPGDIILLGNRKIIFEE